MNLKNFKKVHDDNEKGVFRNDKGHEITIAKKGISKKQREELESLPIHAADGVDTGDSGGLASGVSSLIPDGSPTSDVGSDMVQSAPAPGQAPQDQAPQPQGGPSVAQPQGQQQAVPATPGDSLVDEMQKVGSDLMTNQIKSKTYQDLLFKDKNGEDKPWYSKVVTLFGLLVGGAGSGLSKQPNMAMQIMDTEIKNDLESQKQNQSNRLTYFNHLNDAILHGSQASKNYADIAHLATQDAPTKDALIQAYARRDTLDKLYQEHVAVYPEGTSQRQKAEAMFGMVSNATNIQDQSAAAFVNGRWGLYKNQPGIIGGPGTGGGAGNAPAKNRGSQTGDDGINYQKWNLLKTAISQKLPNAPPESDLAKIDKEATDVKEARQIRNQYISSFNSLNQKFLAGELSKNQRASEINALGAKLATLTSHRYNSGEAAAQAEGMFPAWDDWGGQGGKTRQEKYANGLSAIDSLESGTPTMDFYHMKTQAPRPPLWPKNGTETPMKDGRTAVWKDGKAFVKRGAQ